MRWLKAPPVLDFSLALLLAIVGPLGKMASAQEAEPSDFDVNAPVASLRTADLSTDQQRVRLVMKLLKARADTKISHDAYRKGVLSGRAFCIFRTTTLGSTATSLGIPFTQPTT